MSSDNRVDLSDVKTPCQIMVWVHRPTRDFSLIWNRHHYRWRAANFDLCSALMVIEHSGFLSAPHLLWHGYNGHLQGPVTLTPIAERLAVELSLPVFRLRSVTAGIRTHNLPLSGQRSNPMRQIMMWTWQILYRLVRYNFAVICMTFS